ncbi:MAG TPA: DinB family protein [Gemmatimonadaceae bacterium]|nr:DinB family protein [Gemmatimonadaceae bacterium]
MTYDPTVQRPASPVFVPERPSESEYLPYYHKYVTLVPEGDIVGLLAQQVGETLGLLRGVSEERGMRRYAEGKWSIKEVAGHMADTERIFAYRALRIARADRTPLPGYEQDDYVRAANFDQRPLADLTDELAQVRRATVALFRGFDAEAWTRTGTANNAEVSVRALAYIIAGHERHHLDVLRTKYL